MKMRMSSNFPWKGSLNGWGAMADICIFNRLDDRAASDYRYLFQPPPFFSFFIYFFFFPFCFSTHQKGLVLLGMLA